MNICQPSGYIFIANYSNFKGYKKRPGSEKDISNVKDLFKQIGYHTIDGYIIQDKGRHDTLTALESFSKDKRHDTVDSTVVVVMSHGEMDIFYASDGEPVTNREVYEIFSDNNCSALKGKPKLFIFNQCRQKNTLKFLIIA